MMSSGWVYGHRFSHIKDEKVMKSKWKTTLLKPLTLAFFSLLMTLVSRKDFKVSAQKRSWQNMTFTESKHCLYANCMIVPPYRGGSVTPGQWKRIKQQDKETLIQVTGVHNFGSSNFPDKNVHGKTFVLPEDARNHWYRWQNFRFVKRKKGHEKNTILRFQQVYLYLKVKQ